MRAQIFLFVGWALLVTVWRRNTKKMQERRPACGQGTGGHLYGVERIDDPQSFCLLSTVHTYYNSLMLLQPIRPSQTVRIIYWAETCYAIKLRQLCDGSALMKIYEKIGDLGLPRKNFRWEDYYRGSTEQRDDVIIRELELWSRRDCMFDWRCHVL